jgi:DNA-binding IclR family transcriptional regulator
MPPSDLPDDDNDRLFVTALARGLAVLRAFQPGDKQLGNQDLAQRTGLPKSTISRLTYTLCQLGYLVQDPDNGRYQPGLPVLTLGYAALARFDLRERALPLMKALSEETGFSVTLGVREGTRVLYVETVRSAARVGIRLEVGSTVPIATTAIGRALYSALPTPERAVLETNLTREYGPKWPALYHQMQAARNQLAKQGYCASFGDFEPDIHAVAAPIEGSSPLMAINCSGPAYRLTAERWASEIAPRVVELARNLSSRK